MKLLVIAPYVSLPGENRLNRFLSLAMLMSQKIESVTLVTSNFVHYSKEFRSADAGEYELPSNFDLVILKEPGYTRNVSIRRLLSIYALERSTLSWVSNADVRNFDAVYCAVPPIGIPLGVGRLCKQYRVPFIIDIQDVWPESISSSVRWLEKIPRGLLPFSRNADEVYRLADYVVAVSGTYLDAVAGRRGGCGRLDSENSKVIYIGSVIDRQEFLGHEQVRARGAPLKLFYLGALGPAYDLETLITAVKTVNADQLKCELHILGAGEDEQYLRSIADSDVHFHGYLPYGDMMSFLKNCDVAVNPIAHHARQSVTNKLSDYLAVGCPIINSHQNLEVRRLLDGPAYFHCEPSDVKSYVRAINSADEYTSQHRVRWCPNPKFDRSETYEELAEFLRGSVSG